MTEAVLSWSDDRPFTLILASHGSICFPPPEKKIRLKDNWIVIPQTGVVV